MTRETLPLVIELEGERVANLDISEKTLDERAAGRARGAPDAHRGRAEGPRLRSAAGAALAAHPYRAPVIGWRSDVEKATVEVCRSFFNAYYAPNNIVDRDRRRLRHGRGAGATIAARSATLPPAAGDPAQPDRASPRRRRAPQRRARRRARAGAGGRLARAGDRATPTARRSTSLSRSFPAGAPAGSIAASCTSAENALSAVGRLLGDAGRGAFLALATCAPARASTRSNGSSSPRSSGCAASPRARPSSTRPSASSRCRWSTAWRRATRWPPGSRQDLVAFGRIRPLTERLERIRAVTGDDVQRVARTYLVEDQRSVVHVVPKPAAKGER